MKIHTIIPISFVNGWGARFVLWVQGCCFNCDGCANVLTHDRDGGKEMSVDEIFNLIMRYRGQIEGITISGGEPMLKSGELGVLAQKVQKEGLSVITYTGFTYEELLQASENGSVPDPTLLIENTDVLIDGRYDKNRPPAPLRGSDNQKLLFISLRYKNVPLTHPNAVEAHVRDDGEIIMTGFGTKRFEVK